MAVSGLAQLLTALDVVCSPEGDVRHEVDSKCGDVGRADDAADRQRRAELLATFVASVSEESHRYLSGPNSSPRPM